MRTVQRDKPPGISCSGPNNFGYAALIADSGVHRFIETVQRLRMISLKSTRAQLYLVKNNVRQGGFSSTVLNVCSKNPSCASERPHRFIRRVAQGKGNLT